MTSTKGLKYFFLLLSMGFSRFIWWKQVMTLRYIVNFLWESLRFLDGKFSNQNEKKNKFSHEIKIAQNINTADCIKYRRDNNKNCLSIEKGLVYTKKIYKSPSDWHSFLITVRLASITGRLPAVCSTLFFVSDHDGMRYWSRSDAKSSASPATNKSMLMFWGEL